MAGSNFPAVFQIVFNEISAAEISQLGTLEQLELLDEFKVSEKDLENLDGERPYGNDLDPTLNLDVLEASFRNLARWKVLESRPRLDTVQRIIAFQRRLAESGAFRNPRSHIYYLPELYCAYFGRLYAAFRALPLYVHVRHATGCPVEDWTEEERQWFVPFREDHNERNR